MLLRMFLAFIFFLAGYSAYSQPQYVEQQDTLVESDPIPALVMKGFEAKYPGVRPGFWLKEENHFQAQFELKGKRMSAEFNKAGRWINSETVMTEDDLPNRTYNHIRNRYKGYDIGAIILEESPAGNFFEVDIYKEEDEQTLIFDSRGSFVRKDYIDE